MSAKWEHSSCFSYLVGKRCSLRVHLTTATGEWCVLVSIAHQNHHEYREHDRRMPRERVLRHARVLFNAIEGKV